MKHLFSLIPLMAILLSATASCGRKSDSDAMPPHEECNSVYYWKTTLCIDSADKAFLERHDIRRVYMRMFDVVESDYRVTGSRTEPNATIRIDDKTYRQLQSQLQHLEFVPVVYITVDALSRMAGHEGKLASDIVGRVKNMCSYNAIPNVSELQLDCDWTASTEKSFFSLCDSVKIFLSKHKLPWRLSSTIRLHQLSRKVPPVDRGVLMVYNTGSFADPDEPNSIISMNNVRPYMKHLPKYSLHLDVAYPVYSWQLLFRRRKFAGLLNGLDLSDTTRFASPGPNLHTALRETPYGDKVIHSGDMVRQESADYEEIAQVRTLVENQLSGRSHSTILYHFDSDNLSNFTPDEIDRLFSSGR